MPPLRQRYGTGIECGHSGRKAFQNRKMDMSVCENGIRRDRRQFLRRPQMPVCQKKPASVRKKHGTVAHDRKFKKQLIHLRIAVSADRKDPVPDGIEQPGGLLRRIVRPQRIARSVLERIPQQDKHDRIPLFRTAQQQTQRFRRTMHIGKKQNFHSFLSPFSFFLHSVFSGPPRIQSHFSFRMYGLKPK